MKEERPFNPSGETTRAQNIAAIVVTVLFLGGVIGGGIALRRHSTRERSSTQGATGTQMQTGTGKATSGTVVQKVNDLTVTVDAKSGLRLAENDVLIEFRKDNELADVGTVKFSLDMNMPGMVMHDAAKVSATGTPGQYRATIKPDMAGDWLAKLEYSGSKGEGRTTFSVSVKQ